MSGLSSSRWFLLWVLFLATLAFGAYWLYSQWKEKQLQALEVQITKETPIEERTPISEPKVVQETEKINSEAMRLQQLLNSSLVAQESLEEQNEALVADVNQLTIKNERFQRLKRGRAIVNDFISRFLQYEPVLGGQSFFRFFQTFAIHYSETLSIPLRNLKRQDPLFEKFHQDFVMFVIEMEEEDIEAVAEFVGFHVIERAFHLPLTLVASRLIIDIESIDFDTPTFVKNKQVIPERNAYGELIITEKTEILEYSQAQQFFFRRGPQFSKAILIFLKSYLEVG